MPETPQDTLLQSREAKSHFFQRCDLLMVDPFKVAAKAEITSDKFSSWVNAQSPEALMSHVTHSQAVELFEIVGISPVLHFVVTAIDDISPERKMVISELKMK